MLDTWSSSFRATTSARRSSPSPERMFARCDAGHAGRYSGCRLNPTWRSPARSARSPVANSTTGTYQVKVALPSAPQRCGSAPSVVGRSEAEGQEVPPCRPPPCCRPETDRRSGSCPKPARCIAGASSYLQFDAGPGGPRTRPLSRRDGSDRRRQFAGRRPTSSPRRSSSDDPLQPFRMGCEQRAIVVFLMLVCIVGGLGRLSAVRPRKRTPTSRSRPWSCRPHGRARATADPHPADGPAPAAAWFRLVLLSMSTRTGPCGSWSRH